VRSCPVDVACRSNMNVPFRIGGPIGNELIEQRFVAEATKLGMIQLNGHRYIKNYIIIIIIIIIKCDVDWLSVDNLWMAGCLVPLCLV